MKRLIACFTLTVLLLLSFGVPLSHAVSDNDSVRVVLDGLPVDFDTQPIIVGGRTLVPFRAIAEAINVQITWDNDTQKHSVASETPESLKTKIGIAKRNKLSGIAVWRIGLMSNEMWNSLKASAKPQ